MLFTILMVVVLPVGFDQIPPPLPWVVFSEIVLFWMVVVPGL